MSFRCLKRRDEQRSTCSRVSRANNIRAWLPCRYGSVGTDGAVIAAAAGQVVRPFAAPEDRHAVLDWDAGVSALDDHRVDGAAEDALAILDR